MDMTGIAVPDPMIAKIIDDRFQVTAVSKYLPALSEISADGGKRQAFLEQIKAQLDLDKNPQAAVEELKRSLKYSVEESLSGDPSDRDNVEHRKHLLVEALERAGKSGEAQQFKETGKLPD